MTVSAAITYSSVGQIPRRLNHNATVTLANGVVSGFTIDGVTGRGSITVQGVLTTYTPSAGPGSGTAGAGSTGTTINQPTGATNWVADELQGYLLVISSGSGAGAVRPIITNTTTSITVHSCGADSTSVFAIQSPTTDLGAITIEHCTVPVTISQCDVQQADLDNNRKVTFDACWLQTSDASGSIDSDLDRELVVTNSTFKTNADVLATDTDRVNVEEVLLLDGAVSVYGGKTVTTEIESYDCNQAALYIEAQKAHIGFKATDHTSTPLVLVDCHSAVPYGTGIAGGGTQGGAYGIDLSGLTHLDFVGYTTLSGATNDFICDGAANSYANVSAAGGTFFFNRCSMVLYNGTGVRTDHYMTVNSDLIVGGSELLYGFFRHQYTTLAATGTTQGTAAQVGVAVTNVTSATGGVADGVIMWPGANIAVAGVKIWIANTSGATINIYPVTGGSINGGAVNTPITLATGNGILMVSSSTINWESVLRAVVV